ncbi:MAG: spinster family MFS transporter [Opitutaceae bacterium]
MLVRARFSFGSGAGGFREARDLTWSMTPRASSAMPRVTLALLTGLNLCNYLDRYVLPAVLSPIERSLGLSDRQFGAAMAIFMVGYFCTSPIFGYLGDRLSRRWLVFAGILVWCAGTVLSGRAAGFAELVCFRILVGVGEASYGTISPGWIADLYEPARRNNALSIFYLAIPVGSALAYIVGGALAARFGWRTAFLLAGLPGLVLAAALLFVAEPRRGARDGAKCAEGQPGRASTSELPGFSRPPARLAAAAGYMAVFKSRPYCFVVAGYVAQTFAMGGFAAWASAFLERQHHMPYAAADRFFGVAAAATGLVATLAGGVLGTAWRRRTPAGYGLLLAVSAAAAVPFAFLAFIAPNLGWAKGSLVAAMFLLFLSTGPVNTLILETVPAALRASAMAASIFAIHLLGDLWSPALVGWLSSSFGDLRQAILWTLPPALAVSAALWAALAVIQMRTRESPPEPFPRASTDPEGKKC